jgi:hypothetical protein
MTGYADSRLWQEALAPREPDDAAAPRERFRFALDEMRERAGKLAGEISATLPDFTVHDVSHLDALWEMAEIATGEEGSLNPAEAFVFGGAVLVHDLGLALATYPGGAEALEGDVRYRDKVAGLLLDAMGRAPLPDEIDAAPADIRSAARRWVAVEFHAERAERLALVSWGEGEDKQWLIESGELRTDVLPRRVDRSGRWD